MVHSLKPSSPSSSLLPNGLDHTNSNNENSNNEKNNNKSDYKEVLKRKMEEEFNHSILNLRKEIQLKKRKMDKRESVIYNARGKFCQFQKPMPLFFQDIISQQEDNNSSITIIKKTKHYSQSRKKLPSKELQLVRLSTELDLSNLLIDKSYFSHLISVTTQFRKLLSIERNPPIDRVIDSGAVPYLIKFLDIKNILKYVNLNSNDLDLLEKSNIPIYEKLINEINEIKKEEEQIKEDKYKEKDDKKEEIKQEDNKQEKEIKEEKDKNEVTKEEEDKKMEEAKEETKKEEMEVDKDEKKDDVNKKEEEEEQENKGGEEDIIKKLKNSFVYYYSDLKPTVTRNQIYNLQFESTWCLTNIASGSSAHTQFIVASNAVPYFIELLKSENRDVCEQAIWALGNIIGDCANLRDYVLNKGAMKVLINYAWPMASQFLSVTRNFTWTLSNCYRYKPTPDWEMVKDAYPLLCQLLYNIDDEVLTDACWAFSYLTEIPGTISIVVGTKGVLEKILLLGKHNAAAIATPAIRTIGNVATGMDTETQSLLDLGVLDLLKTTLHHTKRSIRKESAWTISNITAGSQSQIKEVIDSGILETVVNHLKTQEFDVAKECAWVISNALSGGSKEDIKRIVNTYDVIEGFSKFLDVKDVKILMVSLEGIENILRAYSMDKNEEEYNELIAKMFHHGVDAKVQKLLGHSNSEIYEKATVINSYFNGDEEEDDDVLLNDGPPQFELGANPFQSFSFSFGSVKPIVSTSTTTNTEANGESKKEVEDVIMTDNNKITTTSNSNVEEKKEENNETTTEEKASSSVTQLN